MEEERTIQGSDSPDSPDTIETQETPPEVRRGWRLLSLALPFTCALCLALGAFIFNPSAGWWSVELVPVTGEETPPGNLATQEPAFDFLPPVPGSVYRGEVEMRLGLCTGSFQELYLMEQLAFHQPGIMQSDGFREDAVDALDAFRRDCEQLGDLPSAPSGYAEVDRWLKKAAAEVGPAVDRFHAVLEKNRPDDLQATSGHLENFIEFTHNAEAALLLIDERRDI